MSTETQDVQAVGEALEPGIHEGLALEDYLAIPAVNASALEMVRRSPLQYRHAQLHAEDDTTRALDLGAAAHLAVLEPEAFEGRYVTIGRCEGVKKSGERCTYSGSVWRDGDSYCGTHDPARGEPPDPSVSVLPEADYAAALGMRDAIRAHPLASTMFEGHGLFESTVVWRDSETGLLCKIRPDRLVERSRMLVELKTARDASPWAFPRQAARLGYHRKLALYRRGLREAGWDYGATAVVAIESTEPHDIACYLPDEVDLDDAEAEVARLLRVVRTCQDEGRWPGYGDDFIPLNLPGWATRTEEDF